MTAATAYLREQQQADPPQGPDRAQQLYGVLAPHLPQKLRDLVASGRVAVGTLGSSVPSVNVVPIKPDGHVILFTAGMMDAIYGVTRAMAAGTNMHGDGEMQPAALELPDIAPRIAHVYKKWTRYHRWPWRMIPFLRPRLSTFDFPITRNGREMAEQIATRAEAFFLAHELGHVLTDRKLVPVEHANNETQADVIGFRLFLQSERSRMGVASATWGIRIFAGLQRAGFAFAGEYPSPRERMEALFQDLRAMSTSDRYVDEISTIAIAYAAFAAEAERLAFDPKAAPVTDERQTRVSLLAILEEMARGRITEESGCQEFATTARAVDPAMRAAIFDTLIRYYLLEALTVDGYLAQSTALMMGGTLLQISTRLPAEIGEELRAAFGRVPKQPAT